MKPAPNPTALVEWGLAEQKGPDRVASGDGWVVVTSRERVLMAVIDGLGKGAEATVAARTAVGVLEKYRAGTVQSLMKRCHQRLMMTRGAVITLASVDAKANLNWLGIGNIEGVVLRANAIELPGLERLHPQGGVVGYQLPVMRPRKLALRPGDYLAFATDGLDADTFKDLSREEEPRAQASRILERHYVGNDDAIVLVARYLGGQP